MLSCQRCGGTETSPKAFLLTCRGCTKTWHHRCLMPPMVDQDLIQLIRATTSGDTDNDLNAWRCRRCKRCFSETPSAMSSREPTASSESREDTTRGLAVASTSTAKVASTADVRVKQESVVGGVLQCATHLPSVLQNTTADARLANDRERKRESDRQESIEVASVAPFTAKRTKTSAANVQQPRNANVQVADAPHRRSPDPTHSGPQVKAARKLETPVLATSEDDVEMQIVDSTTSSVSTLRPTSRVPQLEAPSSFRPGTIAEARLGSTAGSTSEQARDERPADIRSQVAADEDDDPEDLYGPSVERRIIRILPSLAEELREQQRRVAAEKEKRRAPLAPDWVYARHANDPLWKEVPAQGRKRRKATAKKLGDNGLNVGELMDCYTVQNWVREHKN